MSIAVAMDRGELYGRKRHTEIRSDSLAPEIVTFVITGQTYDGGDEDLACADYLQNLFCGNLPDPAPLLEACNKLI